jgi:ceramide glucosyltransferase
MITRVSLLQTIGGLAALADYLADDYELGRRVAETGARVVLTTVPAECVDSPHGWRQVWSHQLRWARTIRVSQPAAYFFSILNNISFWATAFAVVASSMGIYRIAPGYPLHVDGLWIICCAAVLGCALAARVGAGLHLAGVMTQRRPGWSDAAAVLVKDWLGLALWVGAFCGNKVTWRGRKFRIASRGKLVPL